MKKLAYTLLFFFFIQGIIYSSMEKYVVDTYSLSVRKCASTKCEKLGYVSRADTLNIESIKGNWGKVVLKNGVTGYVLVKYLIKTSSNNVSEITEEQSQTENISWFKIEPFTWLKYSIVPFLIGFIGIAMIGSRKLLKQN